MTGALLRLAIALLPALYAVLAATAADGSRARIALGVATTVLHAAFFQALYSECGLCPLAIPGAALSALALAIFVVYGYVAWRTRCAGLGRPIFAATFALQLAATAIGFAPPTSPPVASALYVVHVVTIIASVATLLLAGTFGALYLVMERQMRLQRFGALVARLPKLSELSAMNRRAATIGFVLLTLGFNLGIWLAHKSGVAGFSYRDPTVVVTIATWCVFGIIGLSRWLHFLSGRKAAVTAVCGLALMLVAIAISFVPGLSFHRIA